MKPICFNRRHTFREFFRRRETLFVNAIEGGDGLSVAIWICLDQVLKTRRD
jgi:hypothetical protein